MTNLRFIEARLYGIVARAREEAREFFEMAPKESRFILMLDLVKSTNHRFFRGDADAYRRTTAFYALTEHVLGSTRSSQIIKKIGDGLLAVGDDVREIFESCVIIRLVERMLRAESKDAVFPFRIRIGLGFSEALKRLPGLPPDFLGAEI